MTTMPESDVTHRVNASLTNDQLNALFDVAWPEHIWRNFQPVLNLSLAFVCAYHGNRLVGFLNLACDGGYHGVAYHLTSIN